MSKKIVFKGRSLTTYRKQAGLTIKEFAEKVGVSETAVMLWEGGNRQPQIGNIVKMCKILKLDINYLVAM